MQYSYINRNSLMNSLYTDRSQNNPLQNSQIWSPNNTLEPHLNPSKSKVNIRQSLNKTADALNKTIEMHTQQHNYRHSCVQTIPSQPTITRNQSFQGKFRSHKENNDCSFQNFNRENIGARIQANLTMQPTPAIQTLTNAHPPQYRRKSQCSRNSYLSANNWKDHKNNISAAETPKDSPAQSIAEWTQRLQQLQARVKANQEQLRRIRQKQVKIGRNQQVEKQLNQLKKEQFEVYQFNCKHFTQFQQKIQRHQQILGSVQAQLGSIENGQQTKMIRVLGTRISELFEGFKNKDAKHSQELQDKLNSVQKNIRNECSQQLQQVNRQLQQVSRLLQVQTSKTTCFQGKLNSAEEQVNATKNQLVVMQSQLSAINQRTQKHLSEYRISNKQCFRPITVQTKQIILVDNKQTPGAGNSKQVAGGNTFTDKTNLQCVPRRDNHSCRKQQLVLRQSKQAVLRQSKQVVVRQRTYHVDSEGFLLDENKYYLVDHNNCQLKIGEQMLAVLKQQGMLGKC